MPSWLALWSSSGGSGAKPAATAGEDEGAAGAVCDRRVQANCLNGKGK